MFRLLTASTPFALAVRGSRGVFQSREFNEAVRDVPRTPGGKSPYDVLGVTITKTTTFEELTKVFREKTRECHPDHGGSHDAMAELNAAKQIIKDHHESLVKRMEQAEVQMKAEKVYGGSAQSRRGRDERVSNSGGIFRQNVKSMNQKSSRSAKEIEKDWEEFRLETEKLVERMCVRYEFAVDQARFFRKSSVMTEMTVRERWLRKTFIKGVWETVHELRGDLIKRGARSAQQAQLAEEMVTFAGRIERRLNDNFSLLTQQSFQYQARFTIQRLLSTVFFGIVGIRVVYFSIATFFGNTLSAKYAKEMQ